MKKFRITLNGKTYDVEAEILSEQNSATGSSPVSTASPSASRVVESAKISPAEVAAAPKKPSAAQTVSGAGNSGAILSPLAGKIVSLEAKVGQAVKEGERVLTMEAMKMNTFVVAPRAGTLKEIFVTVGQAVEEGFVLATLE